MNVHKHDSRYLKILKFRLIVKDFLVSLSDRAYDHKNDGVLLLLIILKPFLGRPLLSAPIENHVLQQLLNYNNRKYITKYMGLGKLIKPLYPGLLRVRSGPPQILTPLTKRGYFVSDNRY